MKAIKVPFKDGKIDLSQSGIYVNLTIAGKTQDNYNIPYSKLLENADMQNWDLSIRELPPFISVPKNWKCQKPLLTFKAFNQSQIKRYVVCEILPFICEYKTTTSHIQELQKWTLKHYDFLDVEEEEEAVLIFDERDHIIMQNNISELINSDVVAMGAAHGIISKVDEIPVSIYNIMYYENRPALSVAQFEKIKSFIGTDSIHLGITIMDNCNIPKSIIYLLLLHNELRLNKVIDKINTVSKLLPRFQKAIKNIITLKEFLNIDEIVDYSEMIIGRQLDKSEKLFIAENYKTNAIKSKAFDIKFKLKQRLQDERVK